MCVRRCAQAKETNSIWIWPYHATEWDPPPFVFRLETQKHWAELTIEFARCQVIGCLSLDLQVSRHLACVVFWFSLQHSKTQKYYIQFWGFGLSWKFKHSADAAFETAVMKQVWIVVCLERVCARKVACAFLIWTASLTQVTSLAPSAFDFVTSILKFLIHFPLAWEVASNMSNKRWYIHVC